MMRTWTIPFVLAAATLGGLSAALTGDGLRDAASWAGLGLPVAAIAWAWATRRR